MSATAVRETAISDRGMVASISPRAAAAGLRVLQDGGNAFDAAIAVAAMEWLTTPENCGLGGDTFAVLYDAKRDRMVAINGSGVSGARATRETYVSQGLSGMPLAGWHAAAVMGTPDACCLLNREFGTRPLAELLTPALEMAQRGVIVSASMSAAIAATADKLSADERAASLFLPRGSVPRAGDRLALPDLSRSLQTLAQEGSEPFYTGAIAAEILRASQEADGPFEAGDFAGHQTDLYEPISTTYRGVEVYQTAPPSQGLVVLEWLNLLEGDDLAALGFGSAEAIHLLTETKKLTFADRLRYAGDASFVPDRVDDILSKQFAADRRKSIDMERACQTPAAGSLPERAGDTSYFAVADGEGNAISFIHSMSAWFGSGAVAGNAGFLMNNRAGRGFYLNPPDHPNALLKSRH